MKRMLAALLVVGCTGSPNYFVVYHPVSGTSTQPKASVIQKATIAITDGGKEIESSDGTTGLVISKWFTGDGFAADQNRFRIRVSVDDVGKYEVVAQCQSKDTMGSGWSDNCDAEKRPQFVVDLVTKIDASLH